MHSLTRLRGGVLPPWPYGTQRGGQSGPVHFKHLIIGAEMLRCCGEKARFVSLRRSCHLGVVGRDDDLVRGRVVRP